MFKAIGFYSTQASDQSSRRKGRKKLSARAADRAADEAGVAEANASRIENSADAPRPFVQGRRPFYKTERSTLPTKERQRTNKH